MKEGMYKKMNLVKISSHQKINKNIKRQMINGEFMQEIFILVLSYFQIFLSSQPIAFPVPKSYLYHKSSPEVLISKLKSKCLSKLEI